MNHTTNKKFIIIKDRVEVYKDFTINLLKCIVKYYVDRESLSDEQDIRNHFMWCYDKVNDEFKKEELDFSDNKELREYFYTYYYHQFYMIDDNHIEYNRLVKLIEEFWIEIFSINNQKNKTIITVMIELYSIFDNTINKENNILENV